MGSTPIMAYAELCSADVILAARLGPEVAALGAQGLGAGVAGLGGGELTVGSVGALTSETGGVEVLRLFSDGGDSVPELDCG